MIENSKIGFSFSMNNSFRLCLWVWRGREGRVLEKRKDQVEELEYIGRGGFGGLNFLHNTKPSSSGGTKTLYWKRILGDFGGIISILQIDSMLL